MLAPNGRFDVDLVLWDLDGTLADTLQDITEALNRVAASLGLPPSTPEEVRPAIGGGIRNLIATALGIADQGDPRVARAVEDFRADYSANLLVHTRLYPGVRAVLERLRGKRQAVISNKLQAMTRAIVEGLGIAEFFVEVIGQGGDYPIKPDPASTLAMVRRHGTTPARTLFVGDSEPDSATAQAAGVRLVLVTYGLRTPAEVRALWADRHIDDIRELLDLVR